MTCATVQELIQQRLDGHILDTHEQAMIATHLATCADCRSFESDLAFIAGIVQHLPMERAPQAFVATVMEHIPAAQVQPTAAPQWLGRFARLWAPLAALAGVLILIYQTFSVNSVSLLNLPNAFAEWAALIDWSNLDSVFSATSLFAFSIDAGFLFGISLLVVAIFAMMAQALARPPIVGMTAKR